jgi:hypothetical protein
VDDEFPTAIGLSIEQNYGKVTDFNFSGDKKRSNSNQLQIFLRHKRIASSAAIDALLKKTIEQANASEIVSDACFIGSVMTFCSLTDAWRLVIDESERRTAE